MDELVKPDEPIEDYLTQYSGITEEMLRDVLCSRSSRLAGQQNGLLQCHLLQTSRPKGDYMRG